MDKEFLLERIDIFNVLNEQVATLLDLMQCAKPITDMQSINIAAEMCQTMLTEMKSEVDLIYDKLKEGDSADGRADEHI